MIVACKLLLNIANGASVTKGKSCNAEYNIIT